MDVSELVEQVDIVEYISQYVDLEERGDEWWGLSPFKVENTPSFSVTPSLHRFYDFSSGKYGDILQFIQLYHGCSFGQAVQKLQEFAGIEGDISSIKNTRMKSTDIAKQFSIKKPIGKASSGIKLPDDYMNRYEWREDKFVTWIKEGITLEALRRFQVRYDAFSDRIVHPIKDVDGNIINVCGRTLDPLYKEHGLRKYTYFKPLGTLDTLYGLSDNIQSIQQKKEVIVFEGAKSVMKAYSWGFDNSVAVLTSHVNDRQFAILLKLGVRVVFALDADIDIREDKNIMRLRPYTCVEWITDWEDLLLAKEAPVDEGKEVFQHLYEQRIKFR